MHDGLIRHPQDPQYPRRKYMRLPWRDLSSRESRTVMRNVIKFNLNLFHERERASLSVLIGLIPKVMSTSDPYIPWYHQFLDHIIYDLEALHSNQLGADHICGRRDDYWFFRDYFNVGGKSILVDGIIEQSHSYNTVYPEYIDDVRFKTFRDITEISDSEMRTIYSMAKITSLHRLGLSMYEIEFQLHSEWNVPPKTMSDNGLMIKSWDLSSLPTDIWSNLRDIKTMIDSRTQYVWSVEYTRRGMRDMSID